MKVNEKGGKVSLTRVIEPSPKSVMSVVFPNQAKFWKVIGKVLLKVILTPRIRDSYYYYYYYYSVTEKMG